MIPLTASQFRASRLHTIAVMLLTLSFSLACRVKNPTTELMTGGQSGGGGGSFIVTEDNPWFVGRQPVTYCIETDAKAFSVSKADAAKTIDEALTDWVKTIDLLQAKPSPGGEDSLT